MRDNSRFLRSRLLLFENRFVATSMVCNICRIPKHAVCLSADRSVTSKQQMNSIKMNAKRNSPPPSLFPVHDDNTQQPVRSGWNYYIIRGLRPFQRRRRRHHLIPAILQFWPAAPSRLYLRASERSTEPNFCLKLCSKQKGGRRRTIIQQFNQIQSTKCAADCRFDPRVRVGSLWRLRFACVREERMNFELQFCCWIEIEPNRSAHHRIELVLAVFMFIQYDVAYSPNRRRYL